MPTLAEFKTKLSRLTATQGLDDDTLDDYIEAALMAFSEFKPERVLMKKVPVDEDAEGFYDVPTDALTIAKVLVYNTDLELNFEVERNAQTNARQIRLGSLERPQWLFVGGNYGAVETGVTENTFTNIGRSSIPSDYTHFDIDYFRAPTIERLTAQDVYTVQLFVEHLGYDHRAGMVDNLVDIRDEDPSGDETEIKRSKIGGQFMNLAKMKMESFEKRAISPYGVRDETGRVEYFYGEYGGGYGVIV